MPVATQTMTAEEFAALPDDGVRRWLFRGELRDGGEDSVSLRNTDHGIAQANASGFLWAWLRTQPLPRGNIAAGDTGFLLRSDPDSATGPDVAYAAAAAPTRRIGNRVYFDGPPIAAVEILSPSNRYGEVMDKVDEYLDTGCRVVWVLDPRRRTVTVYRPGQGPELFNAQQTLRGDPELPGFACPVAELFG